MKQNILYKIYMGHRCVYIDETNIDLTATLRAKFFDTENAIDIERVSKIEFCILPSQADCLIYKTYLVNTIKPIYNKENRARDTVSQNIILPELSFREYSDPILDKWKQLLKNEQITLFE